MQPSALLTLKPDTGGAPVTLASHADVLAARWVAAATEARVAYDAWRHDRSATAASVYPAAADRADAAQDALAAHARACDTAMEMTRGV
jgi:hypothetical protein